VTNIVVNDNKQLVTLSATGDDLMYNAQFQLVENNGKRTVVLRSNWLDNECPDGVDPSLEIEIPLTEDAYQHLLKFFSIANA
jgi:hypothetical protein